MQLPVIACERRYGTTERIKKNTVLENSGFHTRKNISDFQVRYPLVFYMISTCGIKLHMPVPVAARSKAQVCGRSPAEIVGSNTTGGMDVCLLGALCVVR